MNSKWSRKKQSGKCLEGRVLASVLTAGLCLGGISTASAADASPTISWSIIGENQQGKDIDTSMQIQIGSITADGTKTDLTVDGKFIVRHDDEHQTGSHEAAVLLGHKSNPNASLTLKGNGDVDIVTYNDENYAHTSGLYMHGGSLNIDKGDNNVSFTLGATGGTGKSNDEVAGLRIAAGSSVDIQANTLTFNNEGYIRGYGLWNASGDNGKTNIKADTIYFNSKKEASEGYGIRHDSGTLQIDAGKIQMNINGDGGSGIRATGGNVTVTGDTEIVVTGGIKHDEEKNRDYYSAGIWNGKGKYGGFQSGATMEFHGDTLIQVTGDQAIGILSDLRNSVTILDGNTEINTKTDNSHGVQISNGKIDFSKNLTIRTEGQGSHGIYSTSLGGEVYLHDAYIYTSGENAFALFSDSYYAKNKGINGTGKYYIEGDMKVSKKGIIDLNAKDQSQIVGQTVIDGDDARLDLSLTDSLWQMTGNSQVSTLTNDHSFIDMTADDGAFSELHIKNGLKGDGGIFRLDIDGTKNTDNSDRIYVANNMEGNQYIDLHLVSPSGQVTNIGTEAKGTVLASVQYDNADDLSKLSGNFQALDYEGSFYHQRFTLEAVKNESDPAYNVDWILAAVENTGLTDVPKTIFSSGSLAYHTWRTENDKLMKRMGDLRHNGSDEEGMWFRMNGNKIGRSGDFGFKNKYTHYELGYDRLAKETETYRRYQGVSVSYTDGEASFARGAGDNSSKALSLYATQIGNKGHYTDVVVKVSDFDGDFRVWDSNGRKITGDYDHVGFSVSAEYGRKKALDDKGLYIEPQAQLTFGYLGSADYTASNGIRVHQRGIRSALGRIGFNFGKDISERTNLYLKANLYHEFGGGFAADLTDGAGDTLSHRELFNDTWFEYGIGAAIQLGRDSHLYFDVERSTGSDFEKDWSWNAGVRFTF